MGRAGEELACAFLKKHGYRILRRNQRTHFGEIDLIAQERGVLCFIEVKTRSSRRFGTPFEAVDSRKRLQVSKAALAWLKENGLLGKRARFDVVSVSCVRHGKTEIEVVKNAFELDGRYVL